MAVFPENGHIIVIQGGRKIWGTDTPPINLLMSAQQSIVRTIAFPDFQKDFVYGYNQFREFPAGGPGDPDYYDTGSCVTLSKILPGEYGPSAGGIYNLPDQVIGTVPAGMNHIDVRVVLSWTKRPTAHDGSLVIRGSPVASPLGQGVTAHLQGGSGVLEIAGGWRRAIHVGLSGTDIVLSRFQSSRGGAERTWDAWGGPTRFGWSYGSSPDGMVACQLDAKTLSWPEGLPGGLNPPYRGNSTQCSTTDNSSYSSTWQATFLITPGRYNAGV
ncbi:hypothetical protein VW29_02670 [Devosia limi DSM 17137]|uniref:Uncharacterized protein n=1 Tax=Devosia limi DSM 17137 TaxID=1121477 RepID=A0A0F5LW06_9HYPH|nr:hypothetical protein [Devosia limi]KKB86476.1 hypothetical protein VW29_02670 [Devosia limi DSM 17137]SHE87459.1 hypothetical protein SAMN02745223_01289 [Devosia limi DSM 17137]